MPYGTVESEATLLSGTEFKHCLRESILPDGSRKPTRT